MRFFRKRKSHYILLYYNMIKTFEEIFTYDRLYQSFLECKKAQSWKGSVIDFQTNYAENLMNLEESIQNGTYHSFPDNITYIHERGKTRMIHSQHIRDRIVHKIVNQDVLIPIFHKIFIYHNSASQIHKGTDFARKHFKQHLSKAYRKWGKQFYVLSIDIQKYFENIPHDYIEKLLREKIKDERMIQLCLMPMQSFKDGKGIGLGSEINQTYALLCLNEFDHIIKEKFRIKEYGRYMDDMYLFLDDKDKLCEIISFAKEYFKNLQMKMNVKKTQISPIKNGTTFLGFRWKLTDTGHVVQIPKKQTVIRNKKRLRKYKKKLDNGVFTFKEVENCYASMRSNLMKGNCRKVGIEMDRYFNQLFIERWLQENEIQINYGNGESDVYSEQNVGDCG